MTSAKMFDNWTLVSAFPQPSSLWGTTPLSPLSANVICESSPLKASEHAKEKKGLEGSGDDDDDGDGMRGGDHGGGKFVIRQLEKFFYGWGGLVADHPFKIIVLCIFVTAACSVGFLNFRLELTTKLHGERSFSLSLL